MPLSYHLVQVHQVPRPSIALLLYRENMFIKGFFFTLLVTALTLSSVRAFLPEGETLWKRGEDLQNIVTKLDALIRTELVRSTTG